MLRKNLIIITVSFSLVIASTLLKLGIMSLVEGVYLNKSEDFKPIMSEAAELPKTLLA